jgi:hypothetical protein
MVATTTALNTLDDERIDNITRELDRTYCKNLLLKAGANTAIIVDYLTAMKIEVNYSPHYGKDTIRALCRVQEMRRT